MLDLNLILTFIEVAKIGNLAATSKKIGLSQPALSHRIKLLEEQVGESLFIRKRSGMVLNPLGKKLFELTHDLNVFTKKLDGFVSERSGEINGELVVSTISGLTTHLFADFLKIFFEKYRSIDVILHENTSAATEELVLSGKADVGIIVGMPQKQSLKAQKLIINNSIIMVASPKKHITKNDLTETKIILHTDRNSRTYSKMCKQFGIGPQEGKGLLRLPSMKDCKEYAVRGIGVAFIARMYVEEELRTGKLVQLSDKALQIPIFLISRSAKYESPALKIFKSELVKYCMLYWGQYWGQA